MNFKQLNIEGALLNNQELYKHLEKIASTHSMKNKSDKKTYPIPRLKENYQVIKEVYDILNEHIKLKIAIHPAGEWLLDNFYIIEEVTKSIEKELSLEKYINFVGIANGKYQGFARIYVLASEIVNYTDNKITREVLENGLRSYQTKKNLSMDEIWNIGIFLGISIIENIRQISEAIYISQIEKFKVESIVERLVDFTPKQSQKFLESKTTKKLKVKNYDLKYPFIEYMSYKLKKYGKKTESYLKILEEETLKTGSSVSEIIKREHFDIAVRKITIGNAITSIKKIQRINFLQIIEQINGVEEVLRKDPAGVYENMDYKTKEDYRNKIKEISKKTKISEMYIAQKILELANEAKQDLNENGHEEISKKTHIGYYLFGKNINLLYKKLQYSEKKVKSTNKKAKIYISFIYLVTFFISCIIATKYPKNNVNILIKVLTTILLIIPVSEFVVQITQYILSKIVKPKLIPKMDLYNGIPKEDATIVVIPTIVSSKEKVKEIFRKLEVDYLANKSKNLYFCLLGDCKQSNLEQENYDREVVKAGLEEVQRLNQKYENLNFPIFHFIYRKRKWNEKEGAYLGWERKRGALTEFSEFLLGNLKNHELDEKFNVNTLIDYNKNLPDIKYIITLDSDTDLSLNSAFELIGSMAHILNKPEIRDGKVVSGYGIIQPRVGINLDISLKTMFTKIFAGSGGIDSYSNAISDIYQDNFEEGIFTGKGIFDLKLYSKILKNEIPTNTVLSHDLLEGSYLRCGLASDILVMDGYPLKYLSFMTRLSRWIRGDWQIIRWLKSSKLNLLSKYKIFDNLRRSLFEVSLIILTIYFFVLSNIFNESIAFPLVLTIIILIFPFILEILNSIIFKKDREQKQNTFTPKIGGIKGAIYRAFLTFASLPYKAYVSLKAILITLYRILISKKHMLEWMTSEEAEKVLKDDIVTYYKAMIPNVILGIICLLYFVLKQNIVGILIGVIWTIAPGLMYLISKNIKQKNPKKELENEEIIYLKNVAKRTFDFFYDNLTIDNNYLIPDNFQEDRKNLYVDRTSSTNIGLSILTVIAGFDLGYIDLKETINILKNIINTINKLEKWNGHLYNWYNIKTLKPLIPRYISTVDSGNFVGYLYVLKGFLEQENEDESLIKNVDYIIRNTDFSKLYSKEHRLFSIGYDIEENKLTDSYYDLLASEARQASLVAIIKRDVEVKHWNSLSRTLTILDNKKGLVSWSGTAFEYLMPNIKIPRYKGSLIDESILFAEMCQIKYAESLGTPWGISESAFNVKDLHSNYQYKAFGIPWLGLKRGLGDEIVIASYGSVLAILDKPKEVVKNLKLLEKYGMYSKYGFYESLDFSTQRLKANEEANVVKTYMAHHQALILLSINNLINDNIFQKRFMENPEVEAVSILLQEKMPETFIVTKEEKEKPEKQKYHDYENYSVVTYKKIDERLMKSNVISNGNYTIICNQKLQGVSKLGDIYVNRFKKTSDYNQGIFMYVKNIENQNILTVGEDDSLVSFMPDQMSYEKNFGYIKTNLKITLDTEEGVEIRCLELENIGGREEKLEITGMFEPILSKKEQDYAHPAFNNLFLIYDYDNENNILEVKRKKRNKDEEEIYLETALLTDCETIVDNEFEIDKEKLNERGNLKIPIAIEKSLPFSQKLGLVTEPMVALRKTIKLGGGQKRMISLIISVDKNKENAIKNLNKYKNLENIKRAFEISRAKAEAESRYLDVKAKEMEVYQKVLGYIIFDNPVRTRQIKKLNVENYSQSDLWKYGISGDLTIILVKIRDSNDIYVIKQVLKMYEFFRSKNIKIDLVFLDEENHSYENYVREEIDSEILDRHLFFLKNIKGGIFVLSKSDLPKKDLNLINFLSTFTIDAHLGDLMHLVEDMEEEYLASVPNIPEEYIEEKNQEENIKLNIENDILKNEENRYYNGYGAFSPDGKEYLIKVNKKNRLPTVWSHIIANENFGTLVTENMGGYTWYKNSRLNRISNWSNRAFLDDPSEIIYLEDYKTGKKWSLGLNPMPDDNDYSIIYGFGYSKYIHSSLGIKQELTVFVPTKDAVKLSILKLVNNNPERKKLKLIYYIKTVLGEDEIKSDGCIKISYDDNSNMVIGENLYESTFKNKVFVSSSEKIKSFTGDKKLFLGKGGISSPDGLKKVRLNNSSGFGATSCIAIQIDIQIDSMSTKEIVLDLGACENIIDGKNIAYKYNKIQNCIQELDAVKKKWKDTLEKLQIYTPIESMNIMLNGWSLYQTISSRLYGRTGFYQSGGAYGFRDQLQDTLCLKYIAPYMVKNQILKHSSHQFIEGDVEHWWHEETSRGIRTRFSDDLLWLPFMVEEYIEATGDTSILDIQTPYLQGEILKDEEEERYDLYKKMDYQETIYNHSIKAIEKALNFGEHGIPKIGTGDWNDGFSTVGNKGKRRKCMARIFLISSNK